MMSRNLRAAALALALALMLSASDPSVAQTPAGSAGEARPAAEALVAQTGASDGQTLPSGLPARTPPPRTMKAYWPVFVVLAGSWIGIIGFLLASGRRAGRLAERVAGLEERE
jgi:hypothetical protein